MFTTPKKQATILQKQFYKTKASKRKISNQTYTSSNIRKNLKKKIICVYIQLGVVKEMLTKRGSYLKYKNMYVKKGTL